MCEFEIRRATLEDLDVLVRWRMEVLREVFLLPPQTDITDLERANREYYQNELDNGGHIACFALLNGTIVGCGGICLYREMPSPDNPSGRCAYLMNIYVRPDHRHSGAGRAIVRWLTDRARELGITKIYLETSAPARRMYLALGFDPMPDMLIYRDTTT